MIHSFTWGGKIGIAGLRTGAERMKRINSLGHNSNYIGLDSDSLCLSSFYLISKTLGERGSEGEAFSSFQHITRLRDGLL